MDSYLTVADLEEVFTPMFDNLSDKLDLVVEDLTYINKVQCGFMVAIGVLAGLILISYLLERF